MQKNGISTYSNKKISVGDIRKTQLITTYGVGAIVDFKNDTVVIASTDDWDYSPNDAGEVAVSYTHLTLPTTPYV